MQILFPSSLRVPIHVLLFHERPRAAASFRTIPARFAYGFVDVVLSGPNLVNVKASLLCPVGGWLQRTHKKAKKKNRAVLHTAQYLVDGGGGPRQTS